MNYDYSNALGDILDSGLHKLSTILPSEWAEKYRSMDSSVSRFKGRFSYDITPYCREIVDCLSPSHPSRRITIMKGAQVGFSTGIIEPGVGWIIAENPGNILFLTGHTDLAEEAIGKIDNMIDSCGIRHLIRPNSVRAKGMKTGDTNSKKEFPGGSLVSGGAGNHKLLRQRSVMYGFIDDFDAAKKASKESGSTTKMIEQRFASYSDKMKIFYISTPELKQDSNIEPLFFAGDQRYYNIHCPCCKELIPLKWNMVINEKENAGIYWKVDTGGKLIPSSVGYVCQKCSGFFTDANKYEMNINGVWIPSVEAQTEGDYSYHISSLYAPVGMFDWKHYVQNYIDANPLGQKRNESLYKTFVNLTLGETYEEQGESPKANDLQKNVRNYEIGIIPEAMSERDGNGKIVLLTCACDLNGLLDDARLDYEIVAWSTTGSSYSVDHGSIGTFISREGKKKSEREKWTYEKNRPNSVWREFDAVLSKIYLTDTGRKMKIFISGVDTGYCESQAFDYIDHSNHRIVGLKGDKEDRYIRYGVDIPNFKVGRSRGNLFIVQGGLVKDDLADLIRLKWDDGNDECQPVGFMNFPTPSDGKYLFKNYFSHYEAEHRITETKDGEGIASRWVKKNTIVQNHMFDCRLYNMVLRDILMSMIFKEMKVKNYSWADYVTVVMGKK